MARPHDISREFTRYKSDGINRFNFVEQIKPAHSFSAIDAPYHNDFERWFLIFKGIKGEATPVYMNASAYSRNLKYLDPTTGHF